MVGGTRRGDKVENHLQNRLGFNIRLVPLALGLIAPVDTASCNDPLNAKSKVHQVL